MLYHGDPAIASLWAPHLEAGLREDGHPWDWTTLGSLGKGGGSVRARVIAKAEGVWGAPGLCQALESLSASRGAAISVLEKAKPGARVREGQLVCEWKGPAAAVLAFERPFLNLASYASGIAGRTRACVDAVDAAWRRLKPAPGGPPPRVTATRKTLPGYRDAAIAAVLAGGGHSHRVSLAGGVLIKENHVAAAGGLAGAVKACRAAAPHGLRIECEVRDERELAEALKAGADAVLLDNFAAPAARKAAARVAAEAPGVTVEISGGLDEGTIAAFVGPGVHVLSVGGLTHSVRALDLSLLVAGA